MPAQVTLTVTQGKLTGQTYRFDERTTCIVGRSKECSPKIPNDKDHIKISRHHCLLDINPPDIRVRDFGSLNGTYVNGRKIGQREEGQRPEEAKETRFPEHDLKEGDEIKLGNTVFRVSIHVPPACVDCGSEIPDAQPEKLRIGGDPYRCGECRKKQEREKRLANARRMADNIAKPAPAPAKAKPLTCAVCAKDISREVGKKVGGDYICGECRKNPGKVILWLMQGAKKGKEELVAIRGYAVEKQIGEGGQGAVYLARHERTGQRVALKVMLPNVPASKEAEKRFLRETALTKSLVHPNVVRLHDHGCSDGTFFFTLEFCDGGNLDDHLRQRGGKLPIDEAMGFMLPLLNGLEYAHTKIIRDVEQADGTKTTVQGLVHRDLKPGNFFLSGSGHERTAKIADYGFAKAFDTAGLSGLTMSGSVAGTPPFMPRQQVLNFKYVKPEVDVWAMAASLYYMITGQVPKNLRPGVDPWMILIKESAVPIRQRDPSIPPKLAEVIDTALIETPEIVFKSARELKQALEGAIF